MSAEMTARDGDTTLILRGGNGGRSLKEGDGGACGGMDLPSRIPVLRNNPVFVLEARRFWRGRAVPFAAVGLVGLGLVGGLRGWVFTFAIGWVIALLMVPGLVGGLVSQDREQQRLEAILVTGLGASCVLWGKLGVVMVPLGLLFVPMALSACIAPTADPSRVDSVSLLLAALCAPLSAGIIALAVSTWFGRTVYAIIVAYPVVWAAMGAGWALMVIMDLGTGSHSEALYGVFIMVWLGIVSPVAWLSGARALARRQANA